MYAIISPTFVAFYRRLGPLKSVDRAHCSSYLRSIHEDQQRWLPGIQSKAKGYKYAKLRFLFFSCFLVMPCPLFPDLFWHVFFGHFFWLVPYCLSNSEDWRAHDWSGHVSQPS